MALASKTVFKDDDSIHQVRCGQRYGVERMNLDKRTSTFDAKVIVTLSQMASAHICNISAPRGIALSNGFWC